MSSLADLPGLAGFFSYSYGDDVRSAGALEMLRRRICGELRRQFGREMRMWQDGERIPDGPLRADEIRKAIAESAFFIPIITPGSLKSEECRLEFDAFLAQERELGFDGLVFPILYIDVPELRQPAQPDDDVLKLIRARRYADWTKIRQADVIRSPEVEKQVVVLCRRIVEALRHAWEAEENRRQAEAEAKSDAGANASSDLTTASAEAKLDAEVSDEWRPSRLAMAAAAGVFGLILTALALGWLVTPRLIPHPGPLPAAAFQAESPVRQAAIAASPSASSPLDSEHERALGPKDSFKECDDCPEMVVVPAGSFTMGPPESETGLRLEMSHDRPRHVVTIGRPFAVGKVHVTVDQFAAFIRETAYGAGSWCFDAASPQADRSWRNPGFVQEGSHPAVCLSWSDAKAYVDWLSKKTGKPYRMLTEAEWEYAARSQTSPGDYSRFWFGDDEKDLCRHGNGLDQSAQAAIKGMEDIAAAPCDDGYVHTSPAGRYEPNAFGLYDMSGNARQWTADCWHENYKGAPGDGSAWTAGSCGAGRVVRGGSWRDGPRALGPAWRGSGSAPNQRYDQVGLRVGRTLGP